MKVVIPLLLLFLACASIGGAEDRVLPIVTGLRVEGDAVQTFHCVQDAIPVADNDNADRLTGALENRANRYPLSIPAGRLEISEPIDWPARTGYSIEGVGDSKDLNDGAYQLDLLGGQASRLIWTGNTSDEMLLYKGLGGSIEKMHFQGRRVPFGGTPNSEPPSDKTITGVTGATGQPIVIASTAHNLNTDDRVTISGVGGNTAANGTWTIRRISGFQFELNDSVSNGVAYTGGGTWSFVSPKAAIGIHVTTAAVAGLNVGKLALRDLSFYQMKTAILFGRDLDPTVFTTENLGTYGGITDDLGHYIHYKDNNSDESELNRLTFIYPFDSDYAGNEPRRCVHFRTQQAVDFNASGIRVGGNCDDVFYFEYGGRFGCNGLAVSGATSSETPVKLLHLKHHAGNNYYSIRNFNIDGSIGGTNEIGNSFKLLQMDNNASGNTLVELSGTICPVSYQTPIVEARGSCTVVLRDVYGLNANSLLLTGWVYQSTHKGVCNVRLENCAIRGCSSPSDLIKTTADETGPASSGPFRLSWTNCTQFDETGGVSHWGLPFADGAVESSDLSVLTIDSGVVTATGGYHSVDTEGGASSDSLDTINGGAVAGQVLVLRAANSAHTVVVANSGNIKVNASRSLDNDADTVTLVYDGTSWNEVAFSDNGG